MDLAIFLRFKITFVCFKNLLIKMISLTPYSLENPVEVSEEDYNKLVQMKEKGWSHCDSKEECLAKLHYLRSGFSQGKISIGDFNEREKKLVIGYWNRGS